MVTGELCVLHRMVCEYQPPADETLHSPHATAWFLAFVVVLAAAGVADFITSIYKEKK